MLAAMARWMWWCVVASLTLVLAVSWLRPQLQSLAIRRGPDNAAPPEPACPPQTLETEGVCVPVPGPTSSALDESTPPGDNRLGTGSVSTFPEALQTVAGTSRELALAEAPVPKAWRAAGRAFATRPQPGAEVVCPALPALRILALDVEEGWVLLESASAAAPGTVLALFIAGLRTLAPSVSVGAPCAPRAALGTARDQVVLSARRVPQPFDATVTPPAAWFIRGTDVELDALLQRAPRAPLANPSASSTAPPR
jgi:hypothetical protein